MGERLAWYQVASHLRAPVEELKRRITYTEFLEWLEFLVAEEQRQSKQDFYMAQIAAEIRRANVTEPRKVKISDFLLQKSPAPAEKAKQSKLNWAACLHIDLGKN